jgi:NADH-quinone oxidoreductase subunit K
MMALNFFNNLFTIAFEWNVWIFYSFALFFVGSCGVFLSRRNIIILLMSVEIMLLALNLNFICFGLFLDDLLGEMCSLFLLTIGACESAIGLALVVAYYKTYESVLFRNFF